MPSYGSYFKDVDIDAGLYKSKLERETENVMN